MGFRRISDFNKALLGKHGWRLFNGEHTLMWKVFKAPYYLRGNFMEAGAGFLPSYAWRSMSNAREVFSEGSQWRIGNGDNLRIWQGN